MAEFQTDVRVTCTRKQWVAGCPAQILHLHPSIPAAPKKAGWLYRFTALALFRHEDGSLWLLTSTVLTGGGISRVGRWAPNPKHQEFLEHWEGDVDPTRLMWLRARAWLHHKESGHYRISLPAKTLASMSALLGDRGPWLLSRFAPHHARGLIRTSPEMLQTWLPL